MHGDRRIFAGSAHGRLCIRRYSTHFRRTTVFKYPTALNYIHVVYMMVTIHNYQTQLCGLGERLLQQTSVIFFICKLLSIFGK